MNWFQIVFLRENSQVSKTRDNIVYSCELISNCIFTWEFTRFIIIVCSGNMLWIDFKLYFYVRIHKFRKKISQCTSVVNWFQIVFLRENSQESLYIRFRFTCCELISNCIFTWEFTRKFNKYVMVSKLWIDFKLYFYVRIHKII